MVVCLTVDLETKEGIKPTKKLAEAVNYNLIPNPNSLTRSHTQQKTYREVQRVTSLNL